MKATGGFPGVVCGAGADGGTVLTPAYESSRIETEKDRCETLPAECRNSGISLLSAIGGTRQGEVGEDVKKTIPLPAGRP